MLNLVSIKNPPTRQFVFNPDINRGGCCSSVFSIIFQFSCTPAHIYLNICSYNINILIVMFCETFACFRTYISLRARTFSRNAERVDTGRPSRHGRRCLGCDLLYVRTSTSWHECSFFFLHIFLLLPVVMPLSASFHQPFY